jgi:hypothetical protein
MRPPARACREDEGGNRAQEKPNLTQIDRFSGSRGAGCPAMLDGCRPLNMKEPGNRVFRFRLIVGQDGQSIGVFLRRRFNNR